MSDFSKFDYFREASIVEKVVEGYVKIGGEDRRIRIEAHHHEQGYYVARGYIQTEIFVNRQYVGPAESTFVWEDWDLPWTKRDTADEVLVQALGFVREKLSGG